MDKYKYSYERTSHYCYPNSDVLVNKFNIRDEELLDKYERQLVAIRQAELIENPVKGNLDFEHLKLIHRALFQDLYYWAGNIRNCNISKQDLFCLAQYIESYASSIFENLERNQYFINQDRETLIDSLTNIFGDINALHPFREGNGRSQREFINILARINGYNISFVDVSAKEMIEASHKINNGDNHMMKRLFKDNFEIIDIEMQLKYIECYIKDERIKSKFKNSLIQSNMSMKSL